MMERLEAAVKKNNPEFYAYYLLGYNSYTIIQLLEDSNNERVIRNIQKLIEEKEAING